MEGDILMEPVQRSLRYWYADKDQTVLGRYGEYAYEFVLVQHTDTADNATDLRCWQLPRMADGYAEHLLDGVWAWNSDSERGMFRLDDLFSAA